MLCRPMGNDREHRHIAVSIGWHDRTLPWTSLTGASVCRHHRTVGWSMTSASSGSGDARSCKSSPDNPIASRGLVKHTNGVVAGPSLAWRDETNVPRRFGQGP